MLIGVIVISLISSLFILTPVLKFLKKNNQVENYNNQLVSNSAGIFITINALILCTFVLYAGAYTNNNINIGVISIVLAVLSTSFTGYIDDSSYDTSKGLTGHLRALLNGQFTCGMLKSTIGLLTSLIICIISGYKNTDFIINLMIISLTQNFFNLLDTRPGRAIKVYLAFSLLNTVLFNINHTLTIINIGIIISIVIYAPYELKEVCMLGDTGSNTIGIIMGIIITSTASITFRLLFLFFLIYSHGYAEKKSINSFINNYRILRYLDLLGRKIKNDDKN